ncbi:hypothetical protein LCGC14_2657310 [marine sediment metagenome]|uniref:Uncharacterized protein n=1 Tax=marine sediment metagenome TaxID=412755 RepID=A0A0F9C3D4_9ZZZZ
MLDKNKEYAGFSTPRKSGTQPSANFRRVKVLFEDDISYYVESLIENDTDSAGHGIRRSVKKHCYQLYDIRHELKTTLCKHDVLAMDHMIDALMSYQIFVKESAAKNVLRMMSDLLHQDY